MSHLSYILDNNFSKDNFLMLTVPLFLLSFVIAPSYSIVHAIFYCLILPCSLVYYKDFYVKELYQKYKWIFGFLLYFSISSLWSVDFELKQFFREMKGVACVFIGVCYLDLVMRKISTEKLLNILKICSIITSIVISLNLIVFYSYNSINVRMEGYFASGQEIKSGWLLGSVIIFMLSYVVNNKTKYINFYALLALPLVIFMVLTQSRGPILALCVALLVFLYQNKNYKSILAFLSVAIIYSLYLYFVSHGSRGSSYRLDIWTHFMNQILAKPIIGYGILTDTSFETNAIVGQSLFKHTHNVFIACLFHGGIIGGILFFKLIFDAFIVFKNNVNNHLVSTLFIILIFSLACFLTDGTLPIKSPKPEWLNFWTPIILISYLNYYYKSGIKDY